MKVYVSKHPISGWLLNIPRNPPYPDNITVDKRIAELLPFALWQNRPSVKDHVELEFCEETGETFEGFIQWVKWTLGVQIHLLEIEII